MLDPSGHIMKRWLSRQSNLGTVSLDYQLSDQPVFGEWKIRVIAQGQIEESTFLVEEYYQTRFEVSLDSIFESTKISDKNFLQNTEINQHFLGDFTIIEPQELEDTVNNLYCQKLVDGEINIILINCYI